MSACFKIFVSSHYRQLEQVPAMRFLGVLFSFLLLQIPVQAAARENIIIGALLVSMDYDHRQDKGQEESSTTRIQDIKQLSFRPTLTLTSTTGRDKIIISIGPAMTYDFVTDHYDTLDQLYSIVAHRFVTRHWKVGITENYRHTNDASQLAESSTPTTDEYGRRAYWSNQAGIYSTLQYGRGRQWTLGYNYDILRNDDTGPQGYENYDRHNLNFSLQHKFTNAWSLLLKQEYIQGLFDPPEGKEDTNDLMEYRTTVTLTRTTNSSTSHFITCDYTGSRYEGGTLEDTNLYNLTLGGLLQLSPQTRFDYGGGVSYEKADTFSGRWGGNGFLDYSYSLRRTTFNGAIRRGYDTQNFTGTNEQGMVAYWQYDLGLNHNFSQDLKGDLNVTLRDEDQEQALRTIQYNKKIYTAATGLTYAFLTDYTAGVRYTYTRYRSELRDDYDEHRLFFSLRVQQELLKW